MLELGLAAAHAQPQQRPAGPAPAPAARPGQGAPLEIDITQGSLKPIPIAVPEFLGDDPRFALEVSDVVAADLERSGLFQPLDRAAFIDRPRDLNAAPRFQDWRILNAQALVVGKASRGPDGRVRRRVPPVGRLRRPRTRELRRFVGRTARVGARLGRLVADQVYQRLTARRRAVSTPRWCSSTRPDPRTARTSGSP